MATVSYETCPTSAPFFGFMGVTAALCFASKFQRNYVIYFLFLFLTFKNVLIYIIVIFVYKQPIFLLDIGAAYGTAKSGVGISSMGVMNPQLVMRNIIPVVMAGVLGIYGLIVAVIIQGSSKA